jgi:hypothetical protein
VGGAALGAAGYGAYKALNKEEEEDTPEEKIAAVEIPSGREFPPQQQQAEGVDETVKRKMQFKWKDKMQKIDQGMSKLELQREQAAAEMQLEERQLQETEQLKAEQKAFDNQIKEQQRQQKINEVMPQNPMGMPGQQQGMGMQQQQPGLARQQQPQGQGGSHQMPAMPKMAGAWDDVKTSVNDEKYFKATNRGYDLSDIKAARKRHIEEDPEEATVAFTGGPIALIAYRMKQLKAAREGKQQKVASEDKYIRRTKKITRASENMILKIAEEEDWDTGDELTAAAGGIAGLFAGGLAGREVAGRPGMFAGAVGGSLLGDVAAVAIQRALRRKKNILQPPSGVGFMI